MTNCLMNFFKKEEKLHFWGVEITFPWPSEVSAGIIREAEVALAL
jgi:hypothetical protein